ncbi:MAG: metallophosphoesterase [Chitinophagaceae bacterium]|nr:metallophosphoesterase [Oligoflexus sp.]
MFNKYLKPKSAILSGSLSLTGYLMRRIVNPFIFIFTSIVLISYWFAARELTPMLWEKIPFALPFIAVWLVPVLFWFGDQAELKPWTHTFQWFAYLSMGWLNFVFFALLPLTFITFILSLTKQNDWAQKLAALTPEATFGFSVLALVIGFWRARRGPSTRIVPIQLETLPPELNGFKIVQISDLHIGPTIHKPYVDHVVDKTNALDPDLIVLTGDLVDGTLKSLKYHAAPLGRLKAKYGVYLILGNHDYYSGADAWTEEFRSLGMTVLLNSHDIIRVRGKDFMLAGVLDPAVTGFSKTLKPDPSLARGPTETSKDMFRILLAHNPKLAPEAAHAGFHLQISGHTHAGQFIPWTWIIKMVHKPHYAGLSEEGAMVVYVSAGTGSWGPPLRFGTSPELTLLELQTQKVLMS